MTRYRYEHPAEWLDAYIRRHADDPEWLLGVILALTSKLTGDDIQDLFQAEMDADGYFDDLDKPTDAEESP